MWMCSLLFTLIDDDWIIGRDDRIQRALIHLHKKTSIHHAAATLMTTSFAVATAPRKQDVALLTLGAVAVPLCLI